MSKAFCTAKHFVLIADILNECGASDEVAIAFADRLETTNPLFKRDMFITACGVENGTTDNCSSDQNKGSV